jgi:hypothetical protein
VCLGTLAGDQTVHCRGYCIDLSSFNNSVSTVVFILKRGMGILKMTYAVSVDTEGSSRDLFQGDVTALSG